MSTVETQPSGSVTIPSGMYPGFDPPPGLYVELMHFCNLMTGTTSTLTDPAAWRLRGIEAPAPPAPTPGDTPTAVFPILQFPRDLGLGDLSGAEKAAWRRWQNVLHDPISGGKS